MAIIIMKDIRNEVAHVIIGVYGGVNDEFRHYNNIQNQ